MKIRYFISDFWEKYLLSILAAITVGFTILLLPDPGLAQEDTLKLLGINNGLHQARGVSSNNKYAFVADCNSGISVFSYATPTLPTKITEYTEQSALDIEIQKSLAYCAGIGAFYIRDISNPLESQIIGSCPSDVAFRVHLFDTLALVMYTTGVEFRYLDIIDISDPELPQVLSTLSPFGSMHRGDAYKKGNYVYWADRAFIYETGEELGRIIVFDITDPTNPFPIVVDTCLKAAPFAIWIENDYAYVAEGYGGRGLMVLDISDPYNIDSVGCFPISEGTTWNVYIKGNYAYVCAHLRPTLQWDRIYVLDISDPIDPTLVTYYNTPGCPQDVFVDEPYVLVAEDTSLLVFEASFLRQTPGDINADGVINLGDVVFLISYLYKQGSPPDPIELGDINGNCVVDLGDVVYLISYLYKDGPAPMNGC